MTCETAYNSGHTATVLRTSAKIRQSRNSYVRIPLYERVLIGSDKDGGE